VNEFLQVAAAKAAA